MPRKTRSNRRQSRKQQGGARKTHRKASNWAAAVKKVYHDLKKKNPAAKLGDAMKEASKLRAAGKL